MIVVLRRDADYESIERLIEDVTSEYAVRVESLSDAHSLLFVGDTASIDDGIITRYAIVSKVVRITDPFVRSSRSYKATDTIVNVGGVELGGDRVVVMAGPCSIDGIVDLDRDIAQPIERAGGRVMRAGAFKPRTSPYTFQGMGLDGLDRLAVVRSHMPVVSEIVNISDIDTFVSKVDMIQVGARNMQNFELLKALGKVDTPVLLKRGAGCTIDELLMSAEYILASGNPNVVLCERGVRAVDNGARATLDITAIPVLKERTHLPVILDPSHAAGKASLVPALCRAGIAAGADGLIIEVHSRPEMALTDGRESIDIETFERLMPSLSAIATALGRRI